METDIKINLENVDVTDIMRQIHDRLRTRGYDPEEIKRLSKSPDNFEAVQNGAKERLAESVNAVSQLGYVEYWWQMPQGGFKGFTKKVVRKLSYFYMKHCFDQQNQYNSEVRNSVTGLYEYTKRLQKTLSLYEKQLSELSDTVKVIQSQSKNAKYSSDDFSESRYYNYKAFEDTFRGSEDELVERQRHYLKYFEGKKNVVDIGCGRGEFLSLVKENGIEAVGVDLIESNIEECYDKGLDVIYGDGVNYLKGIEDKSLGGIFSAQVIEHMSTDKLIEFIKLSYEKLEDGACLVMETLNPKCLMIYAESLYLDPTHTTPVHPETVSFFAKQSGFSDIHTEYFSPTDKKYHLPFFENKPEADTSISTLNDLIFGNREYAVIARKQEKK